MNKKLTSIISAAVMFLAFMPAATTSAATVLTENKTGAEDGYNYELWKDNGTTSMTLNKAGTFDCSWSNINNALFRKGKKFDCTKTYKELGNISIDYGCDYKPNGNSYLCVYGWTKSPLVEYYIVDSWGSWRPPGATAKGTTTIDGDVYDIYETDRINQPSIEGNTTFKQFWSVRRTKRTSGIISVSKHFEAWEKIGMKLGKLYEVALNIEGYQSQGTAKVYKNNLVIGDNPTTDNPVQDKPVQDKPVQDKPVQDKPVQNKPVTSDKLKVNYTINNWGSGYQVSFKVSNNSTSDVNGWSLKIKKNSLNINSSWNINVKESGDYYIITPVAWNSNIAKGNSVDFGVQGNGSIGNSIDCSLS